MPVLINITSNQTMLTPPALHMEGFRRERGEMDDLTNLLLLLEVNFGLSALEKGRAWGYRVANSHPLLVKICPRSGGSN